MKHILLLLLLSISVNAFTQSKSQQIDSLLTMLTKQSQFNGNVLILNNGNEILKKSYGFSNRETKENLNEHSIFELASLTKQFTATAIILLKQQEKLNYSDKIISYFPDLKFCNDVTIKNLLNHTSGIPDYIGIMIKNWDKSKTATNSDVIKMLATKVDTLRFKPNSKFEYSNSNYVLLASIIEKISNQSYSDYMETKIFSPLDMKSSFILNRRYKPRKLENYAYGYVEGKNQKIVFPDTIDYLKYVVYLDGIVGDGMMNSTINDLKKWDESLRNYALITKENFEDILALDTLSDGKTNTYSFGWNLKQNKDDTNMSHSGSWPGYVTYISRSEKNKDLIVILQNYNEIVLPVKTINEILSDKLISKKYNKEISLSVDLLNAYVGEYIDEEDENSITHLKLGKNSLIFNSTNNQWDMPFYPNSKNTFFSKNSRMDIGFKFINNDGHSLKLIFIQNGKEIGTSTKK